MRGIFFMLFSLLLLAGSLLNVDANGDGSICAPSNTMASLPRQFGKCVVFHVSRTCYARETSRKSFSRNYIIAPLFFYARTSPDG